MRYLSWIGKVLLFLILVGFALKNSEMVTLRYFLGQQWRAPLSLLLLLFFGAGALLGVLAGLAVVYRQRRELGALRQSLAARRGAANPSRQPDRQPL